MLVVRTKKPVKAAKPFEPEILPRGEETPKKDVGKSPELPEVEVVFRPSASTPKRTGFEVPMIEQSAPGNLPESMTISHSPSLPAYYEEAIREARALRTPDISGAPGEDDPFRDCFTGVDDAYLNDASTLFEEAQRLFSKAFTRFRADLSQYEAELKKSSGEGKALKLLCSKKEEELKDLQAYLAKAHENEAELDKQPHQKLDMIGQLRGEADLVKAECNRWKENMDRLAAQKETTLDKLASTETQLRGVKEEGSAQAKRIIELETKLAKAKVAEARAEVEKTKATTDKNIFVY